MADRGDTFPDPFPDAELHRLARGVCKIEMTDSSGKRFKGTGFHFGGGWVMSVAHNYQDDDRDTSKIHSMIKTAKFTFCTKPGPVIDADGAKVIELTAENSVVFDPQERMAFIHHLKPGEDVDFKNEDIAMIKLGIQWKYMRDEKDYKDWETCEERILGENKLPAFVVQDMLRSVPIIEPKVNDEAYAMHFGGNIRKKQDHNLKLVTSKITKKTEHSTNEDGSVNKLPMLHLDKPGTNCPFPGGASGCPVLMKHEETGKYGLVGLHFSGDDDDDDGTAEALQWTKGIREYVEKGVDIIIDSETYLSNKAASSRFDMPGLVRDQAQQNANDAREELLRSAEENNLTIYLPTLLIPTEVLNG